MNEKIIRELNFIKDKNDGLINPETVVEYASKKDSVLHDYFTWDDGVAAHQYRLEQARKLIRICVIYPKENLEPIRMFVSLRSDRNQDGGYRLLTDVLSNDEQKAEMLYQALEELKAFKLKYNLLKEFSELFNVVDNLVQHQEHKIKVET